MSDFNNFLIFPEPFVSPTLIPNGNYGATYTYTSYTPTVYNWLSPADYGEWMFDEKKVLNKNTKTI